MDAVAGPHGPVRVRRYAATASEAPAGRPTIVWVHGGAFLSGGLDQHETHEVAAALAARGWSVVTVDYRRMPRRALAPFTSTRGRHWPRPVDEVAAVVQDAARRAPGGVVVGGASAGASLVASALVRDASGVRAAFFAYGLLHATLPPRSADVRARVRGLRRMLHAAPLVDLLTRGYAGAERSRADAFPGGHPAALAGFPPTLVLDADRDVLRASGEAFARELAAASVPVTHEVVAGSTHGFLHRHRRPAFADGIGRIAGWLGGLEAAGMLASAASVHRD